jgi:lysozyme
VKASKRAEDKIKHFEGLRLEAYRDAVGIWTVGYGQTGPHVGPDTVIEPHEADELLQKELDRISDRVTEMVAVELEQHQFDALVSLAYNIGLGAFKRSTLLKHINAGDFEAAAKEFPRWVYAKGRKLPGLKRRRLAEQKLFLGKV